MSDQADSQAPAPDTASFDIGGEQQQAPDPVMARFDALEQQIQSMTAPQAEPEPDYGDYAFDGSGYEPTWDEDGYTGVNDDTGEGGYAQPSPDDQQAAMAQLNQLIQEQVANATREAVSPYIIQQKAAQLEQKYPDLQRPEVAQHVVQSAERFAQMVGREMGMTPQQQAMFARSPELIERLYLADRAQRIAGQETPANGGPGAHFEGASAQVEQPEGDFMDRIVNAGQNDRNRFGWM